MIIIDLLVCAFLCFTLTYQLATEQEDWCMPLIWSVLSVILTILLCASMKRIRKYTKGLAKSDSLESRGLLCGHQGCFIAATVFNVTIFILKALQPNLEEVVMDDDPKKKRIQLACIYLSVGGQIAWFIVHCLMLTIFLKYGKPMEDDEKTLL